MKGYAVLLVLLFINPHAQRKRGRVLVVGVHVIGKRSEPPSHKLGGEKNWPRTSLYVCHCVLPDNQYHAYSHCVCTLTL